MLKKLNKLKIFILVLCLFFIAGLSNALALSVDIKNFYYSDSSFTVNNYDFTSGSRPGDWIEIPPPFAPNDGRRYMYGLFPGSTGYTLSWTAPGPATLSISAGVNYDGAAIFYLDPIPDDSTARTAWTYSTKLQNFADFGDSGKTNIIAVGMGSDVAVNQPQIIAVWLPNGNLQLVAMVGEDPLLWQSSPVTLSGLTPALTTLELKLVNTGSAINFYYNLNAAGEILIDTFESGDGYAADSFKGFPILLPFVWLGMEDTFHAFSFHQNNVAGNKYYASAFVDDPGQGTYSGITVSKDSTCGEALTNVPLSYFNGQWWLSPGIYLSTTIPPACYPTFNFTALKNAGGTDNISRTVTGYVTDFATNLSPTGTVNTGTPTFSWTGIAGADGYFVQVSDASHMIIWGTDVEPDENSVVYSGPALTDGQTYYYSVMANIETGGGWNNSQADASFMYAAPSTITVTGSVKDFFNNTIATPAVTVSVAGSPGITTTASTVDGSFSLSGVPSGTPFYLKISATGYLDLYTKRFSSTSNFDPTCDQWGCEPYQLPKVADLSAFGANPSSGNAVIYGRVSDNTYRWLSNVDGAVVTATSNGGSTNHTVVYRSPFDDLGGTSTYLNGRYYILNVSSGVEVDVQASKSGWTFGNTVYFNTHADSANTGRVFGVAPSYSIAIGGTVRDTNGTAIGGVAVALRGDIGKTTTSGGGGGFTLGGLPQDATFYLMLTKGGYAQTNVGPVTPPGSVAGLGFTMWTPTQVSNVSAGGGVIAGSIRDGGFNPLSGATITVTSKSGTNYNSQICYADGVGGCGSSTSALGFFYIPVASNDVVRIDVTKTGYTFESSYMNCWSAQVTERMFIGTAAAGSTLYADFAGDGLYQWSGSTWTKLTSSHPASMVASGTSLYVDFAGDGFYKWNGSGFSLLTKDHPASMVASGTSLYAGFVGYGLYQWNGSTWITLTNSNPASMVASGTSLYAGFVGYGLYQWNGSTWITLTNSNPASMVASGTSLYAGFVGYGLYQWNGSTWITLTNSNPASMVASGTSLYADFTEYGLFEWNGSTWITLTNSHPASMVASGTSLYADFAGDGLYQWSGSTWTKLTNSHPASMVASGTSLYADFAGDGLYEWNGSTWTKLISSHPASMVVGY